MTQEKKRNLFQKLNTIMGLVGSIPKSGYNTGQKYKFVTESDVMDKVREAALSEGVIFITSLVNSSTEKGKYSSGGEFFLTTVEIEIEAIDIDNPGDRHKWRMVGQGADSSDKASNKGITGAVKYGFLKTFLIGTGDDAEHDKNDHDYSPAQARNSAITSHPRLNMPPSKTGAAKNEAVVFNRPDDSPPPHDDDDVPDWMRDEEPPAVLDKQEPEKTYHYLPPFDKKERAKALGCRWNKDNKTWDSKTQIPEFDAYIK